MLKKRWTKRFLRGVALFGWTGRQAYPMPARCRHICRYISARQKCRAVAELIREEIMASGG